MESAAPSVSSDVAIAPNNSAKETEASAVPNVPSGVAVASNNSAEELVASPVPSVPSDVVVAPNSSAQETEASAVPSVPSDVAVAPNNSAEGMESAVPNDVASVPNDSGGGEAVVPAIPGDGALVASGSGVRGPNVHSSPVILATLAPPGCSIMLNSPLESSSMFFLFLVIWVMVLLKLCSLYLLSRVFFCSCEAMTTDGLPSLQRHFACQVLQSLFTRLLGQVGRQH